MFFFVVEDPSDEFEVLRDYVDVLDCMKLPTYQFENVRKGYSLDMQNEARTQLKMTKVNYVLVQHLNRKAYFCLSILSS